MSALYTTKCNGCGAPSPTVSPSSLMDARMTAAVHGWTHPKPAQDFCRACSAARAEFAKKESPNGYL